LKTPVETTKTVYVKTPVHKTKKIYVEEFENSGSESITYSGSSHLITPVQYRELSSHFGVRRGRKGRVHKGVDFAAPSGTPIVAAADGTVSFVGRKSGYGKMVIIQHDKRHETFYAHMSTFATGLTEGQRVKQGKTIGYVGRTGRATGDHLHYEFRVDGTPKNPLTAKLPSSGKTTVQVAKSEAPKSKLVEKTVKTTEYIKTEKTVKTTEYVKTENVVKDKQDFIKQTQPILAQLEKARQVAQSSPTPKSAQAYESKLAQALVTR